mmetsp:Transcript_66814/g.118708  ORF Transcript_66814/g.118708 Transcript_66814/m.118708 type:complete len:123 (+) Transcript_66814:95-463(+)
MCLDTAGNLFWAFQGQDRKVAIGPVQGLRSGERHTVMVPKGAKDFPCFLHFNGAQHIKLTLDKFFTLRFASTLPKDSHLLRKANRTEQCLTVAQQAVKFDDREFVVWTVVPRHSWSLGDIQC